MKHSEFVFNYIHLFYYKCYKINLTHQVHPNFPSETDDWKKLDKIM